MAFLLELQKCVEKSLLKYVLGFVLNFVPSARYP